MNPNNVEVNKITKERIAIAARDLMLANSNVSVSNICKKAGVSRNAFYRNFETTDDIFIYYLILKWAAYSEEHNVENASEEGKRNHLICFFYSEKDFVLALKRKNLTYIVEKLFVAVFVPKEMEGAMRYYLYAVSYLIYGLIKAMIDNDFKETPEQIIAMAEMMNNQKAD